MGDSDFQWQNSWKLVFPLFFYIFLQAAKGWTWKRILYLICSYLVLDLIDLLLAGIAFLRVSGMSVHPCCSAADEKFHTMHTMLTLQSREGTAAAQWLSRIQKLSKRGEWQQVLRCLGEVPPDVALDVVYSMAATACGRSLRWQLSLELLWDLLTRTKLTLPTLPIPNMIVVGSVLGVLQKASKWKQAGALLTWFWQSGVEANSGRQAPIVLYNCTVASFGASSKWQGARSMLNHCRSHAVQPDVVSYTLLMNNCESTTQWQTAVLLLQHQSCGVQPDIILCNVAMSACSKSALWRSSQLVLQEMGRAKLRREAVSFNTAASACEKAQQWAISAQTLTNLRSRSMEADVISFSVVLDATNRRTGGSWQACWGLFDELQQRHVQPDLVLLNALTETAEWQRVLVLLQTQQMNGQNGSQAVAAEERAFINSAMGACGRQAIWVQAQELLRDLKTCNQADLVSYTSLIASCTYGNWAYAQAILEDVCCQRIKEDVVAGTAVIKACEVVGEWKQVLSVLTDFESRKLQSDVISYNDSISSCAKSGQWQQAGLLLLALQLLRICSNTTTLNSVLHAHNLSREWQRAHKYLAQHESVADLVTLNEASTLFDRAGELSATRFLSSVEATCQSELKKASVGEEPRKWDWSIKHDKANWMDAVLPIIKVTRIPTSYQTFEF